MPTINNNLISAATLNLATPPKTSSNASSDRFDQMLSRAAKPKQTELQPPKKVAKPAKPKDDPETEPSDEVESSQTSNATEADDQSSDANEPDAATKAKKSDSKSPAKKVAKKHDATDDDSAKVDGSDESASQTSALGDAEAAAAATDADGDAATDSDSDTDATAKAATKTDDLNAELIAAGQQPTQVAKKDTTAATDDDAATTAAVTATGKNAQVAQAGSEDGSQAADLTDATASQDATTADTDATESGDLKLSEAAEKAVPTKHVPTAAKPKQVSLKPGELRPVPQTTVNPSLATANASTTLNTAANSTPTFSDSDTAEAIDAISSGDRGKAKDATDATLDPTQLLSTGKPATSATPSTDFASHLGAPNPTDVTANNHDKIVQVVKSDLTPNGGSMKIRLDPPELGALQVTVKMNDGVMTASFETSTDNATKMLSHSLGQLKTALESSGVSVEKLHVQQAPKDSSSNNNSSSDDSRRGQTRGSDEGSQQGRDQQRKEMIRRMWAKLGVGDPLDLVA